MTMGGIDTMLVDIVNKQIKYADVTILVINNQLDEIVLNNLDSRIKLIRFGRRKNSKNVFKLVSLYLQIFFLNPDIIHCHNSKIIKLLPFIKKPIVLTVHDIGYESKYYNLYDTIFAISESVKKDIQNRISCPVRVVYNGIDTSQITIKRQFNTDIIRLLCISRLEHTKKGQDLLIQAFSKLEIKNSYLDFIGEGTSLNHLSNLIEKYNLGDKVIFLGKKSRDYVYKNISKYDLLVQPSRYEGFGLTIVESMAAKVPVLVSNIDGPAEIIENERYGYSFKSDNVENLTDKLNIVVHKIIKNDNGLINKINSAYKVAKDNYDIEISAKNYYNIYCQLIDINK